MEDVSQLTPYQQLKLIESVTGCRVTLGRYETVKSVSVEKSRVCLVLNRVSFREGLRTDTILHEGISLYEWRLHPDGQWHAELPITSWWKPEVTIVERFSHKTEAEQRESYQWAVMCERPGSAKYPMDWMQSCRPLEY